MGVGNSAVAVGNEAYVYAGKSVGIGNNVQAIEDGAMVYGLNSYAGGDGSIAIGKSALSNVAPSRLFKETLEQYGEELYEGESNTSLSLYKLDKPGEYIPRLKDKIRTILHSRNCITIWYWRKKAIIEKDIDQNLKNRWSCTDITYMLGEKIL